MEQKKLEERLTEKEWIGKWVGRIAGYVGAAAACYFVEVRPEQAALLALPIVKGAEVAGGVGKYVAKYFG